MFRIDKLISPTVNLSFINLDLLYDRKEYPLGEPWEEWVAKWCKWLLSIPKKQNPSLDQTGSYCSVHQYERNVWFLAGTFGNVDEVIRCCTIPAGKSIFFPILAKEDSLIEDADLKTESALIRRCADATSRVRSMKATVDGKNVDCIQNYRVRSKVFDLVFPEENVYDVQQGKTRSVCDGFWVFLKPLKKGRHRIHFEGETSIVEPYIENILKTNKVYSNIREHIHHKGSFTLNVSYNLNIVDCSEK